MRLLSWILVVCFLLLIFTFHADAREYSGRRGSSKGSSPSKKSVEIDASGNIAGGLDDDGDDDDDEPQAESRHASSRQFRSRADDEDDEDDEDEDDEDSEDDEDLSGGDEDFIEESEDSYNAQPQNPGFTIRPDGSKEYHWINTERTTALWHAISQGNLDAVKMMLNQDPDTPHYRSEDGRGGLWWAYEFDQSEIVELLIENGASETDEDSNGETPAQLAGRARG